MKLETRLGLATGGLILALLFGGYVASGRILYANQLSGIFTTQEMPLLLESRNAEEHTHRSMRALQASLDFEEGGTYRAERAEQMAAAEQSLRALEAAARQTGETERMRNLREALTQLKTLEENAERLTVSGSAEDHATALKMLETQIIPLDDRISDDCMAISAEEGARVRTEIEDMHEVNRRTVSILWLATLLSAFAAGFVTLALGRNVSKTLQLIAMRACSIADGDLTGGELRFSTNDQVGQLADAMNRMQASLGSIIGTVADTAGSLTGSAASMRSASDGMHRRIDQQSQQTQQAATAMQEMSASIAEVSRHTQSAAETARAAAQTAREGGLIVKQMLGSMHSIATAVADTRSTVGLLGEDSKRISQIVTVIDEIARKTNLLALNAAIEAARAGDQGRGFAVVAGEVRRLAESTAQATGEIAAMIQEIQDRTLTAVASMASGTGTVETGVLTTRQAGEALERIIGMAERVDRMITQIAIAASQQAAAADQSSASLDSIHLLSHENLSEMATTAAGIESLRGTAVALERHVDRFQVQHGRAA